MSRPLLSICVCTYRRPHLARTLRSLAAAVAAVPDAPATEIVVADDDTRPSARPIVDGFGAEHDLPVAYRHVASGNISVARNACLDAARGDLVAFVDDDERVERGWLAALLARRAETGADVVLGPVRALYPAGAPRWMRAADPHGTRPVLVRGEIRTGYTCNVLMDVRAPALGGRRFDRRRGRTGGEDTAFFDAARRAGARIAFAPEAWAEEDVTPERLAFGWLARRRFRSGQTHASLLAADHLSAVARARAVGLAGAKALWCGGAAALALPVATARNRALLRGALHLGAVASLLGRRDLALYGGPDLGSHPRPDPRPDIGSKPGPGPDHAPGAEAAS